jgi:uncharacterized membrane protein YqjE
MTNPSNGPSPQGRGLGASLQGLMATVLAIIHTRLELLVTELEEEKRRLLATVAWGAVGVLVGCFALAFAAVFITVLFWDSHRLLVVGLMTLTFGLISAWAMHRVKVLVRESGQMLSVTLAELDADRQALMPSAPAPVDEAERKP